jgi:hypothetical protein
MGKKDKKKKRIKSVREQKQIDPFRFFDKDYKLPQDITALSASDVRKCHSYWGEQYVFCQSRVAYYEAQVKLLEPSKRYAFNKRYIRYKTRNRDTNEIARIKAEMHKSVTVIQEQINSHRVQLTMWVSLTESCRVYQQICSRDQSYREKDLEYYNRRGGRGR